MPIDLLSIQTFITATAQTYSTKQHRRVYSTAKADPVLVILLRVGYILPK
jgi:hypothetical protein